MTTKPLTRKQLSRRYLKRHKKLVEPMQGWDSLAEPLHLPYSMGRKRGFTDLGTYVNKSGDHGGTPYRRMRPAWAYDLGRKDRFLNRGWNYVKARRYCKFLVANAEALDIEYVILGMRIWSRRWASRYPKAWSREKGWHRYQGDTSHMFHIHVSGHWPGRV